MKRAGKAGFVLVLLVAVEFSLYAQLGRYPGGYPPRPYPGRYPNDTGVGIPRGKKKTETTKEPEVLANFSGKLQVLDDHQLVLKLDDSRLITCKRTAKTRFLRASDEIKPSEFHAGDKVSLEATQDEQGYLYAVNVRLEPPGAAKEPSPAAEAAPSKQQSQEAEERPQQAAVSIDPPKQDDPNRPILRRGIPSSRKSPDSEEIAVEETPSRASIDRIQAEAPPTSTEDPLIEKARDAAANFSESLPNYVCQELMTRSQSSTRPLNWQTLDVVSYDLVYENGREDYRNPKINGKSVKPGAEREKGAWSTGEFGTLLIDVLSTSTAADFRLRKEDLIGRRHARVYDFEVDQQNSHWNVMIASQSINPAYKGAIWIDKETARVLRIEMQARKLPASFPVDRIESSMDYDFIRFDTREFLLPVHAENLACQRGTNNCSWNTIDFRNYHKYSGEASITFEK